jgi:hypothetical protein
MGKVVCSGVSRHLTVVRVVRTQHTVCVHLSRSSSPATLITTLVVHSYYASSGSGGFISATGQTKRHTTPVTGLGGKARYESGRIGLTAETLCLSRDRTTARK